MSATTQPSGRLRTEGGMTELAAALVDELGKGVASGLEADDG